MLWVLFALIASFIWALVNIIDKYVLTKWVRKPIILTIVLGAVGLLASLMIYLFQGFEYLSYLNIGLAFIAGILYMLANAFYFYAAKLEEISRVVPLFHLTPLLVLILAAIFLGEIFTPIKYFGIFLLITGAVLISTKNYRLRFGKAFNFMLLSILCFSVNLIMIKYLLNFADFWTVFSYERIGTVFATLPIFYLYFNDFRAVIRDYGKKAAGIMTFNESMNASATLFFTIAASFGFITLVESLASTQSFFVLLLAVILSVFYPRILKEEIGKSVIILKLVAIILMFIGVILII